MNHAIYTNRDGQTVFLTATPTRSGALRLMTALRPKYSGRIWAVPMPVTKREIPAPSGDSMCHRDWSAPKTQVPA